MRTSDLKQLGMEMTLRIDFEARASGLVRRLSRECGLSTVSVLRAWAGLLGSLEPFVSCVPVCGVARGGVEALGEKGGSAVTAWTSLFQTTAPLEFATALRDGRELTAPYSAEGSPFGSDVTCIMMVPCPCTSQPWGLAAAISGPYSACARSLVHQAADRAGMHFALERGHRQMASRVAHMTSSSILIAQLRLASLVRELADSERPSGPGSTRRLDCRLAALRDGIAETQAALEQAQQGLDRARLLSIPGSHFATDLDFGPFVSRTCQALNAATDRDIVAFDAVRGCGDHSGILVYASETRLAYALRDLAVGTWLLCGQTAPTTVNLCRPAGSRTVELRLRGRGVIARKATMDRNPLEVLRDPELFLNAPDPYRPVGSMGFDLACALLEEMKGRIEAKWDAQARAVEFTVGLPVKAGGGRR